jgi:subtilisin family serine protease
MRSVVLLSLLLFAPCASADGPCDVVVALAPGAPGAAARPAAVVSLAVRFGLTGRGRLDDGLGTRGAACALPWRIDPARILLFAAPDSARAAIAASALAHAPGIAWTEVAVSRDPAVVRVAGAPGISADPMFADTRQWGLWNAGPAGVYGGRAGADIHAQAAWARSTGSAQVRLGVADTGVDPAQPELAGTLPDGSPRVAFARDVTADALPAMADSFGHGTLVAGVMAARTGEGAHFDSLGVAGVCGGDGGANPGCVLVPIRITRGHTGSASSADIARALLYAADVGARAVNLSFASPWPSHLERLAIAEALARGTVTVCAAGNHGYTQGPAPQYPAAHSADGLCVQVGASDPWDARAVFSSYGPGLDLVAPGVDVWTTFMTYPSAAGAVYDGYVAASGTSFAAPFVTGTIGLLAAVRPELAADDFQTLLRLAADDVGDPGVDAFTGAGRLNAARALELVGTDRALAHRVLAADAWRLVAVDTLRIDEPGVALLDALAVARSRNAGRRPRRSRCPTRSPIRPPRGCE